MENDEESYEMSDWQFIKVLFILITTYILFLSQMTILTTFWSILILLAALDYYTGITLIFSYEDVSLAGCIIVSMILLMFYETDKK